MITNTSVVTLTVKISSDVSCQACRNQPATSITNGATSMPSESSDIRPEIAPIAIEPTNTPRPMSTVISEAIVKRPLASTAPGLASGTYQPPRKIVVATPLITNRFTHSTIG